MEIDQNIKPGKWLGIKFEDFFTNIKDII